jgi:release factor glutamine methyltransferase
MASWKKTEQVAARCKLNDALKWAASEVRQSPGRRGTGQTPIPPPTDRVTLRMAWRVGSFLATHVPPRRLGQLFSGTVGFGSSPARCRFGGVEILAGPGAFVPEMPSERLAKLALGILSYFPEPVGVEPGTGCGAISLAIAAGHPGASIHAIEKYRPALRWAKRNARRQQQKRVHLHRGSLLDPLPQLLVGRVALIVANLPYVPSEVWAAKGRFVRQTIRGQGDDGLGLYRRLVRQALSFLQPGGYLVLEMGPYQVDAFRSDVTPLGYSIERVEPEILGAVVVIARLEDVAPSGNGA